MLLGDARIYKLAVLGELKEQSILEKAMDTQNSEAEGGADLSAG